MTNVRSALIYIEMYLYKARKLIVGKYSTLADLEEAEMYLNICRNLELPDEYRIDLWYAKLELRRHKLMNLNDVTDVSLMNAKDAFLKSLAKQSNSAAHFGLYKISVVEENWSKAEEHLLEYEKSNRKKHYNFNLVHKMLSLCMDKPPLTGSTSTDYIFSNRITYKPLLNNYQLAEEAFDQGRYNACLKHLTICRKLALLKNITIDFTPLITMIINIIKSKNHKKIDELKISINQSSNYGEKIVLIRRLISLLPQEKELYFLLMDSYIGLGVISCIPDIIQELSQFELSEMDLSKIAYYENLKIEQDKYADHFQDIFPALQIAEESATEGNISSAYDVYLSGYKKSGQSVFLYKIAELFYLNGYYENAEHYYLLYLKVGYENKEQAYINLYKIYRRSNLDFKCRSIAHQSFQELFLSNKGYTLKKWIQFLEDECSKEMGNNETEYKVKELGVMLKVNEA